ELQIGPPPEDAGKAPAIAAAAEHPLRFLEVAFGRCRTSRDRLQETEARQGEPDAADVSGLAAEFERALELVARGRQRALREIEVSAARVDVRVSADVAQRVEAAIGVGEEGSRALEVAAETRHRGLVGEHVGGRSRAAGFEEGLQRILEDDAQTGP